MMLNWNKVLPGMSKNPFLGLLKKKSAGGMSMDEFMREIAYGALDVIKDMGYEPEPQKPGEVLELDRVKNSMDWSKKSEDTKSKVNKAVFGLDQVKEYFDEVSEIRNRNESNLMYLKQWLNLLDKGDTVNQKRFIDVIKTHDRKFQWLYTAPDTQNATRVLQTVRKEGNGDPSQASAYFDEPQTIPELYRVDIQRGAAVSGVSPAREQPVQHVARRGSSIRRIPEGDH